jgi:tRNA-splicing ligase RtcB
VGYDINCGTRLLATRLSTQDLRDRIKNLVSALFQNIPSGVGSKGPLRLSAQELRQVLKEGSAWAVKNGYGRPEDLDATEDRGCMAGADPGVVSEKAMDRGKPQLGTLGSGNHFLEVGFVDEIYDPEVARVFGLRKDQITVLIHSGSADSVPDVRRFLENGRGCGSWAWTSPTAVAATSSDRQQAKMVWE